MEEAPRPSRADAGYSSRLMQADCGGVVRLIEKTSDSFFSTGWKSFISRFGRSREVRITIRRVQTLSRLGLEGKRESGRQR